MAGGDGVCYTFLAVNNEIITRTELKNDLTIAAENFLSQLPEAETYTRYLFSYGGYNFHYAVEKSATYGVLSKDDIHAESVSLLLDKVRSDYLADSLDSFKMKEHLDRSNEPANEYLHKLKKAVVSCTVTDLKDVVNLGGGTGLTVRNDLIAADKKKLETAMYITELISMISDRFSVMDTVVKPDTRQLLEYFSIDIDSARGELLDRLTVEGENPYQKQEVAKRRGGAPSGCSKRYWLSREKTYMLELLNKYKGRDRRKDSVDGFFAEFYPGANTASTEDTIEPDPPSRKQCINLAKSVLKKSKPPKKKARGPGNSPLPVTPNTFDPQATEDGDQSSENEVTDDGDVRSSENESHDDSDGDASDEEKIDRTMMKMEER